MKKYPFLSSLLLCPMMFAGTWHWPNDPHEVGDWINNQCLTCEAEKRDVAEVIDRNITCEGRTTPLRVYVPNATNGPIILLIHGGAWVGGNLDTHDNLARYLCHHAESMVVSVGYLNAPEGKFPYPLEQCYDTLLWITKEGNAQQIAVVGDSAGGNMAAALCLMARDRFGPSITMQVLINPAPDLTGKGTLERQNDDWDVMRWQALHYVNNPEEAHHPYVSPLVASDLTGLPPALVVLAEKDFLFEDGKKYADRLKEAGVPTEIYIQPEIDHLGCDGARATTKAQPSLDAVVSALCQNHK